MIIVEFKIEAERMPTSTITVVIDMQFLLNDRCSSNIEMEDINCGVIADKVSDGGILESLGD